MPDLKTFQMFTMSDVVNITGLTRRNLEHLRINNLLVPSITNPIRYSYEQLLLSFAIFQLKKHLGTKELNCTIEMLHRIDDTLSFFNLKERLLLVINDKHIVVSPHNQIIGFIEFEDSEYIKYFEDCEDFFEVGEDETNTVSMILKDYYVVSLENIKNTVNKLIVDNNLVHKLPEIKLTPIKSIKPSKLKKLVTA